MSLKAKTLKGVKWSGVSQFGRQGISFVSTAILARLLTPADYGLLGMAMVFIGFLNIFGDLGTSAALIQKKEISEELLSSVFWVNILFGLLTMVIVIVCAPLIAFFYHEARITEILRLLSVSFLISSMNIVHLATLQRNLDFDILARIELGAAVFASITGIVSATAGYGVWSLVIQSLVNVAVTTVFLWSASRWKPKMIFNISEIKSVSKFSLNLVGFSTLNYFSRNGDNLIIGKFLGAQELGYYNLAYQLMLYPLQSISAVIGRVLFPVFSQLQSDDSLFRSHYLKLVSTISFVSFPMMLGLMAVANSFVLAVFGNQWKPAVILLMILAPIGMLQSVGTTVGLIYQAKGRTDLMLRWGAVSSVLVLLAFLIGVKWGAVGVASAYGIVSLMLTYHSFAIPFKLIGLPFHSLLHAVRKPFLCSSLMLTILLITKIFLSSYISEEAELFALIATGVVLYLLAAYTINRNELDSLSNLVGIRVKP